MIGQAVTPAPGSKLALAATQPAQNYSPPVQIIGISPIRDDDGGVAYKVLLKNNTTVRISEKDLKGS